MVMSVQELSPLNVRSFVKQFLLLLNLTLSHAGDKYTNCCHNSPRKKHITIVVNFSLTLSLILTVAFFLIKYYCSSDLLPASTCEINLKMKSIIKLRYHCPSHLYTL